jgi:hypothetical protein
MSTAVRLQPEGALAEKGFSTIADPKPPSANDLETSLAKASAAWIISPENLLTPDHVRVIKNFFDAGYGVTSGATTSRTTPTRTSSGALLARDARRLGRQTVGMRARAPRASCHHLLTTGLENIYEGITIATITKTPDLEPLIYGRPATSSPRTTTRAASARSSTAASRGST